MRLLILFFAGVALCSAEQTCPWLNAATAGGVLGGAATATVNKGACEFTAPEGKLRIFVSTAPEAAEQFARAKAKCGKNGKVLPAIGNEAVACPAGHSERVVGRVRDQVFTITVTMKGTERTALFDKGRFVAEEVSGNLF